MADGKVDVIISDLAIKNIENANKMLGETYKLILKINEQSRNGKSSGSSGGGTSDSDAANRRAVEKLKLQDQELRLQKKLIQSE